VATRHSDMFAAADGTFDLIVSNPPYLLDSGKRVYRHGGGMLGSGFSVAIVEQALERLIIGGSLLLYTGSVIVNGQDFFRAEVARILAPHDCEWEYTEIDPDVFGEELEQPHYADAERIAVVWLRATRKGKGNT
jgi:methylase of polypeptide subunit release factors